MQDNWLSHNSLILEYIYNSEWPLCKNLQLAERKNLFHYLQIMAKITNLNYAKVVSAHGLLRIKTCSTFLYIKFSDFYKQNPKGLQKL